MDYARSITADPPYGEAVPKAALQAQGFGTLTEIDVQATAQDSSGHGGGGFSPRPRLARPGVGYVTASDNREGRVGLSARPARPGLGQARLHGRAGRSGRLRLTRSAPVRWRTERDLVSQRQAQVRMRAWPGCVTARRCCSSPFPRCCCWRAAWRGCWRPGRLRACCGSPAPCWALCFRCLWTVGAIRRRQPSVDVIAVLALAGALAVGEPFAGAVITVMLASGQLLEARASARARRELSLLAGRAPRTALRRVGGGVAEVAVDDVVPGDRLLVGAGGIVPVDGRLLSPAVLDESALTGESRPAERIAGEDVRSGVVNAGQPIDLVATAAAAESTYAGVVRLVEQAQASSAPFVRAADRFAVLFVPVTLVLAAAAWALSADPVRAVAVLVVATPCPLLLAAPIAIMSGLSRAARIGVVVKGGGALERLAAGQVMLFDKTGTLTQGRPGLAGVVTAGGRWTRTSCCGSPPRWTRSRRTSWRAPSSPPPPVAGLPWRCRTTSGRCTATAWRGPSAVTGCGSARPPGSSAASRRGGCARCAGALTWTAR